VEEFAESLVWGWQGAAWPLGVNAGGKATRPGVFDDGADGVGWKFRATHKPVPGVHDLGFLVRVRNTGDTVSRCHETFSVFYAE